MSSECGICLTDGPYRRLPCGHAAFCGPCLDHWSQQTCPLCRSPYGPSQTKVPDTNLVSLLQDVHTRLQRLNDQLEQLLYNERLDQLLYNERLDQLLSNDQLDQLLSDGRLDQLLSNDQLDQLL